MAYIAVSSCAMENSDFNETHEANVVAQESLEDEDDESGISNGDETDGGNPISGSILINDGDCCAGGIIGDSVQLNASFGLSNRSHTTTQMKVKISNNCETDPELMGEEVLQFSPNMEFSVVAASNWVGHFISVQFIDENWNVSEIYCDDISVEGMPNTAQ